MNREPATTTILTGRAAGEEADSPRVGRDRRTEANRSGRLGFRRWMTRRLLRAFVLSHKLVTDLVTPIGRLLRRRSSNGPKRILLTGTFYSENWIESLVAPMAASREAADICIVTTYGVPPMEKVSAVFPPDWLCRVVGKVPARLIVFCLLAIRRRPDVLGGFHLLINGLVALTVARLVGARSLYFSVGGPMEVLDGGIWGENRLFALLGAPDAVLERRLLQAIGRFDQVITMGSRAAEYFREHGADTAIDPVPGGIDASRFEADGRSPDVDIVVLGRLVEVKRVDVFLQAVHLASRTLPSIRAVVVGDGDCRDDLQRMVEELGIESNVQLVGRQPCVISWLRRARLFALCSDSEGLALALIEAMMCGLPAVVSNVGELTDLVHDGINGYVVSRRDPAGFAERFVELLSDDQKLADFTAAARQAAMEFELSAIARRWDAVLAR